MKWTILAAIVVTGLIVTGLIPALAANGHCDADLKAVDAAMSKSKLSDADMAKVKTARARANELQKAGKDEQCEQALADAQKLLGIKDTHKH